MKHPLGLLLTSTCAGLYAMALLLPTVNIWARHTGYGPSPGWLAFQVGVSAWMAPGDWDLERGVLAASWLANPAIWFGLACSAAGCFRWATWCGLAGFMLTLLALIKYGAVVADHPGFWLWAASAGVLFVGAWLVDQRLRLYKPESIALTIPTKTVGEKQLDHGFMPQRQFSPTTIQR